MMVILVILVISYTLQKVRADVDCPTVTQLLNTCSVFISNGSPDPLPGSPCCDAVMGLSNLGDNIENRRSICRCLMGLIAAYSPDSTSIATLPGFCGVSLGFVIDPNTDCNM
ncbi:putative non-specific lipid-transfer protein 14 [Bienertia sinuspersici]